MPTAPSKSNVDRFINSLRSSCSAGSLSLRHSFAVQACIAHKPSDDDDDIYIMMKCLFVCHEKWSLPQIALWDVFQDKFLQLNNVMYVQQ